MMFFIIMIVVVARTICAWLPRPIYLLVVLQVLLSLCCSLSLLSAFGCGLLSSSSLRICKFGGGATLLAFTVRVAWEKLPRVAVIRRMLVHCLPDLVRCYLNEAGGRATFLSCACLEGLLSVRCDLRQFFALVLGCALWVQVLMLLCQIVIFSHLFLVVLMVDDRLMCIVNPVS